MTTLADAVSISFVLAFLFAGVAPATAKPCVAAKADDLSTVWVGETVGEYFRLELGPDGTGLLTAQWAIGKPARAYRVVGTTLSDRRVEFRLDSLDDRGESLYLRGNACRGLLELQMGSHSPKWRLDVAFQPYATLLRRLEAVNQRAEQYAAERGR